jgi:hypothetical protein
MNTDSLQDQDRILESEFGNRLLKLISDLLKMDQISLISGGPQ